MSERDFDYSCNFCGKSKAAAEKLIAGPGVFICDECVRLSYEIIQDDRNAKPKQSPVMNLDLSAQEIKWSLDQYITGQDHVKEILSVAAVNHIRRVRANSDPDNRVHLDKSNILLMGKTGTGKTLFARTLAQVLNIPIAITDATALTESGYVGEDVESILERLLINANYDVDAAESGIIFVDEIDKKATRSSGITNTRDISGTGVQQALLKIAEGSNINVKLSARNGEVINMDTTNILFVFSGSFVGIEDIISARQHSSSHIGFTSDLDTGDHRDRSMRDVNIDDLTAYGIIPELVGRMPIIAVLDDLTQTDMITILSELHTSPVRQLQALASQDGITLEFSDEFLESLSEAAVKHRLGGRSLRGLLDDVTTHVFYRIADFKKSQVITVRFNKYLEPPTLVHQDGSENIDTAYKTYRGQNA